MDWTKLRYREQDTRTSVRQTIGSSYWKDITSGKVTCSSAVLSDVYSGELRQCFDKTNPYPNRSGGPLWIFKNGYESQVQGIGEYMSRRAPFGTVPGHCLDGGNPSNDWRQIYKGGFTVDPSVFVWTGQTTPIVSGPTDRSSWINDDVEPLGNRGYKLLTPKVGNGLNLFQSLAEAKEVPKMLHTSAKGLSTLWKDVGGNMKGLKMAPGLGREVKARFLEGSNSLYKRAPSGVSDQFLNNQFGWVPFLNDLVNLLDLVDKYQDYVKAAQAENGVWRKRRFRERQISSETIIATGFGLGTGCYPFLTPSEWVVDGTTRQRRLVRTVLDVWYEGKVRVYRPEFGTGEDKGSFDAIKTVKQMLTLSGTNINPSNLYRITPWTWLIDWFVNVGDFINRIEDISANSPVFDYMYLMRSARHFAVYQTKFTLQSGPTLELEWTKYSSVKTRVPGDNPFTFSAQPGGLSGMQKAILVALGLTKLA